jgi:hypothetical protein
MAEYIDKLQEKYQIEVAKKLINNIKNWRKWLERYHKEILESLN